MRVLRAGWRAWRRPEVHSVEEALDYADASLWGIRIAGEDPDRFPAVAALATLANEVRALRAEREASQ